MEGYDASSRRALVARVAHPRVFLPLYDCALRVLAKAIRRERSARVAAERAAAQSHRLAQTNAAFGHARTSTDAIATAIHEPLHWLRARRRCVLPVVATIAGISRSPRSVGYRLDHRESWDIDQWGRTRRSTSRCGV